MIMPPSVRAVTGNHEQVGTTDVLAELAAALTSVNENSAHAPFLNNASRFNAGLREFAALAFVR
jgi:hypothetical protein